MVYRLNNLLTTARRLDSARSFVSEGNDVEIDIADLQPTQEYVSLSKLFNLAHGGAELFPIVALQVPDRDSLIVGEGHHRTYLRYHLGFTTVRAYLLTNEDEYTQMVATGYEPTLERNGPTLADFEAKYEARWEPGLLQKGITHISHLNIIQ